MKPSPLVFVGLVSGCLLGACALSEKPTSPQAHPDLAQVESSLRVGMSLEEVKVLSPQTGNCRGSAKSYMTCLGSFRLKGEKYIPVMPVSNVGRTNISLDPLGVTGSPNVSRRYETLTLHFKANKLERWDSDKSRH
jgi:hypothetical protein